jgi:hypothetical protein
MIWESINFLYVLSYKVWWLHLLNIRIFQNFAIYPCLSNFNVIFVISHWFMVISYFVLVYSLESLRLWPEGCNNCFLLISLKIGMITLFKSFQIVPLELINFILIYSEKKLIKTQSCLWSLCGNYWILIISRYSWDHL